MPVDRWNPELHRWLDQASRQAGFDVVGVAEVRAPHNPAAAQDAARFKAWIDSGRAGEMQYLKRRDEQGTLLRGNLRVAMPWARSAIVCAMSYNFAAPFDKLPRAAPPLSIHPAPPGSGWIARYAWTGHPLDDGSLVPTDYHDELLARLRAIESALLARATCTTRCSVDTGPLVERALAADAGIGWIGKNTCLLNQQLGSWLLLGVLVTSLPVEQEREEVDEAHSAFTPVEPLLPHSQNLSTKRYKEFLSEIKATLQAPDRCGTCTRCIDACPTGALLGSKSPGAPRQMDASRCIAYLTIEKKGAIDPSLRGAHGPSRLRLRHLPGCLPVEPQAGCTIHRSGCTIHSAFFAEWVGVDAASSQSDQSPARLAVRNGRAPVQTPLQRFAAAAHRPQAPSAQRRHRHGQQWRGAFSAPARSLGRRRRPRAGRCGRVGVARVC